jgi:hypothetical protein
MILQAIKDPDGDHNTGDGEVYASSFKHPGSLSNWNC